MNKILGLANRARKLTVGTEFTIKGVRNGKVKLVILASDASSNTQKLVNDKCGTYKVEIVMGNSFEMSNAIGKNNIMVIGIIDKGFSDLILNQKRK